MIDEYKIIQTGPNSLCVKEFYKGYELSVVMECESNLMYDTRDIRIYEKDVDRNEDVTLAFSTLIYGADDSTNSITADINYSYPIVKSIKRIIDAIDQ